MFCPFCGAKNDSDRQSCFVCEQKFPWVKGGSIPDATPDPRSGRTAKRAPVKEQTLAAIGDRALAVLFDSVFLGALFGLFLFWSQPSMQGWHPAGRIAAQTAVLLLAAVVYYWIAEWASGYTLGKALIGLQVHDRAGGRSGVKGTLLRNALRPIDAIGVYLVAFFVANFTAYRQRIGDLVAETVVVNRPVGLVTKALVLTVWLLGILFALYASWVYCPECFRVPKAIVFRY